MKRTLVFDTECYGNYFLLAFRNVDTGKVTTFEMFNDSEIDRDTIRKIMASYRLVGFNSINYDLPIIFLMLKGGDNAKLKEASDAIINTGLKPWHIEDKFGFRISKNIDHVDIIEVAPGKASLKIYGGRMHAKTLWDLPYIPNEVITEEKRKEIFDYCGNDLLTTMLLYNTLKLQLELRDKMSIEYKEDLRSKSDAQIAEAVIKSKLKEKTGVKPERCQIAGGMTFRYYKPNFISFKTKVMEDAMIRLTECDYVVSDGGKVLMPQGLDKELIHFGSSKYRVGMGGLHSCEESVSHISDDEWMLIDRDVASYYPAIIMNCSLFPKHMGTDFLDVYKVIIKRRLEAKAKGDKTTAESLKITLNGSFGKFGSKWSALYSPDLLIQTTITGQLSLLMLIESLEQYGGQILSANTDGIVIKCRRKDKQLIDNVIAGWELSTGFVTEEVEYKALYSRDINNYIAIKTDGNSKTKGAYTPIGLQKNPTNEICVDAVVAYLKSGKNIFDTVFECGDIRKFLTVRTVNGGAIKNEKYLGKAIRWYYKQGETGTINYKINGNKVPKSEGAQPLMTLPDEMPGDVDIAWYVKEAESILTDIGVTHG